MGWRGVEPADESLGGTSPEDYYREREVRLIDFATRWSGAYLDAILGRGAQVYFGSIDTIYGWAFLRNLRRIRPK